MREEFRHEIESNLQKGVEVNEKYDSTFGKLKFLNKFSLFKGLSRTETQRAKAENRSFDEESTSAVNYFNCDQKWQVCLFDFTYKNKIPQYLCFRASNDPPALIEEYFYPDFNQSQL